MSMSSSSPFWTMTLPMWKSPWMRRSSSGRAPTSSMMRLYSASGILPSRSGSSFIWMPRELGISALPMCVSCIWARSSAAASAASSYDQMPMRSILLSVKALSSS